VLESTGILAVNVMKINKKYQQIGILLLTIILLTNFISAFGVGAPYYKENPLKLPAGGSMEVIFNLQNGPGPDDITARPSIVQGSEILELIDSKDISVPVGSSIDVITKVTIPNDAEIGTVYPVEISFTTITGIRAGSFSFGGSVGRKFDVIIVLSEEEKAKLETQKQMISYALYTIIGIIILVVIIWLVLKKRFKKKKK